MAVQGPIPVEFGQVFPRGVFAAGTFEAVRDFEASKGGRFVQSKDKVSGLPLWVVDVIDADTTARDKRRGSRSLPAISRCCPLRRQGCRSSRWSSRGSR